MDEKQLQYAKNLHNWLMDAKKTCIQMIIELNCESSTSLFKFKDPSNPEFSFSLSLDVKKHDNGGE